MKSVSVATLGFGRPSHLANLVRGLTLQTHLPRELIVAVMSGQRYDDLPAAPFPIVIVPMEDDGLRLAAARNAAAARAGGDVIAFLDIDCIPATTFCEDYIVAASGFDGLLMGEVLYLPHAAATKDWNYAGFDAVAEKHSDRRGPPPDGIEICADYRCFWSLNFAMSRRAFAASGGFDERYVGYGGEDTDFAKGLAVAGVPIAWMKGGLVYHQHHPHHMPPVHHLDSVVANAELFESKWGYRTMGHWLYAFRLMGLIDDRGRPIRILRRPDAADLALTRQQGHQPYTNTATVIRKLEAEREPA